MSTASNPSSGTRERAHAFRDFIEERYAEWESEFGDGVHFRRTTSFDPKN